MYLTVPTQAMIREEGRVPVFQLRLEGGCIAHLIVDISRVQQNLLFLPLCLY